MASTLLLFGLLLIVPTVAQAQNRTLSLYNTHTHERLTVTYKRNGRFVQAGLDQLNRFLRDWRRDEVTRIDPDLFDIVWTVYREVGASEPIHVVSAYRSPATNNMLRRRSSGVARNSQHTQGRAMDFFIPGVQASRIREAGLRLQQGGVGFYPRSRTPFVHLDTGSIRMWPRMTRAQLQRVFPDGRTVHVPSDGRPLAGYELAQRDLRRGGSRTVQVATSASAANARDEGDGDIVLPEQGGNGILSALFGGGRAEPPADIPSAPQANVAPVQVAAASATATPQAAAVATAPTTTAADATLTTTLAVETASAPRERYLAPAPVLPPYASPDGTWAAPSTVAGLAVPSPTPAPTIDEIQLAALGTQPAAPGAIALDAAFASAEQNPAVASPAAPSPVVSREQQIAQTVPAPGQIAAIIEARFAERRASQASLAGQVASAIETAAIQPSEATQATAAAVSDTDAAAGAIPGIETYTEPQDSLLEPGTLSANPDGVLVADAPRFVPPVPTPIPAAIQLAAAPPATAEETAPSAPSPPAQLAAADETGETPSINSLIAAAFAARSENQTPAQDAIASLASADPRAGTAPPVPPATVPASANASPSSGDQRPTVIGITGQLYPIAPDLTPALAKNSIRSGDHATLVAPAGRMALSPIVLQSSGFTPSRSFQLRADQFGASGS